MKLRYDNDSRVRIVKSCDEVETSGKHAPRKKSVSKRRRRKHGGSSKECQVEEELTRKVRNAPDNSRKEREKAVQEWSSDMRKVIRPEERKREARERMRMEQEDSNSQNRRKWGEILRPMSPILSLSVAQG